MVVGIIGYVSLTSYQCFVHSASNLHLLAFGIYDRASLSCFQLPRSFGLQVVGVVKIGYISLILFFRFVFLKTVIIFLAFGLYDSVSLLCCVVCVALLCILFVPE